MFTGIIEGQGTIKAVKTLGRGRNLTVEADFILDGTRVGDSIAINGACLTAVIIDGRKFEVDVSPETLSKTTFGRAAVGERINIERAMRLSDRIDGHLVSGHIDGTGIIRSRKTEGNAVIVTISIPESLSRYMIRKGSIAVDGISLTINECSRDFFSVSIIPHTAKMTTIGIKHIGAPVNIETDMIGKYIERFVEERIKGGNRYSSVDTNLLKTSGFL